MRNVMWSPSLVLLAVAVSLPACKDDAPASEPADAKAEAPEPAEDTAPPSRDGAAPEPDADPEPEPADPTGFAVVRGGASLFFAADRTGAGVELARAEAAPTDRPWGMVVYVLGERDGLLEVDTVPGSAAEAHCGDRPPGIADFRLRLFVDPADLLKVTTSNVEHTFADGTSITLRPGVPVKPDGDRFVAAPNGVRLEVPIDAGSVGDRYEPGVAFSGEGGSVLHGGDPLAYDRGTPLPREGLFGSSADRVSYFDVPAPGPETGADQIGITVRSPCAQIVALADRSRTIKRNVDPLETARTAGIIGSLSAESGSGGLYAMKGPEDEDVWGGLVGGELGEGGFGFGYTTQKTYRVEPGVAAFWETGTAAGQVVTQHTFDDAPRESAGRLCFEVPLYDGAVAVTPLCFAATDVSQIDPPPGGGGGLGLGTIGTIGKSSGTTLGSAYGMGSSGLGGRKKVPRVKGSSAAVVGSLDKDIIRRIVRAHINEVRYCYNQGLVKDPALEGKVSVRFTIGPSGSVAVADIDTDTVADKKVGVCIAKAVKRWKFPKPTGGGNVIVTYPFVLEPGT